MFQALIVTLSFFLTGLCLAGDIVERNFTSGGYQIQVEEMSHFSYPFVTVDADKLLLMTHNSEYWDNKHITWAGTTQLIQYFRSNRLPLYYLADIQDRSQQNSLAKMTTSYFPPGVEKQDIYPYQGDSHRLVMKGHHVVIAGGNFTICACNTVRSIIALSESKQILNIHYAMNAIYEGRKGRQLTLQNISDELSDQDFLNYLVNEYLTEDTLPCKEPTLKALDRDFTYQIYRDGKWLGQLANGKTVVNLFFASSEQIIRQLSAP